MFWELYSRTYYLHGLPPGRMDTWSCLENCVWISAFHIKDKYSTYRSCRSRGPAGLEPRPDGMACLGAITGTRPILTGHAEQWEWVPTSYLCLVSLLSTWEGRATAEVINLSWESSRERLKHWMGTSTLSGAPARVGLGEPAPPSRSAADCGPVELSLSDKLCSWHFPVTVRMLRVSPRMVWVWKEHQQQQVDELTINVFGGLKTGLKLL